MSSSVDTLRHVPMDLYLEDRKEMKTALAELTGEVRAMRREMDRDDGAEVAQEAAEAAVAGTHRDRREIARDVGLCVLSSCLALGVALVTTSLTGAL